MPSDFLHIQSLADKDVDTLKKAQESYGDSWRDRGCICAFMILAR